MEQEDAERVDDAPARLDKVAQRSVEDGRLAVEVEREFVYRRSAEGKEED